METAKAEKCAHPICSCITTSGKYCSAQCEAMEKMPDILHTRRMQRPNSLAQIERVREA